MWMKNSVDPDQMALSSQLTWIYTVFKGGCRISKSMNTFHCVSFSENCYLSNPVWVFIFGDCTHYRLTVLNG